MKAAAEAAWAGQVAVSSRGSGKDSPAIFQKGTPGGEWKVKGKTNPICED